jgi:hypothetical protein
LEIISSSHIEMIDINIFRLNHSSLASFCYSGNNSLGFSAFAS